MTPSHESRAKRHYLGANVASSPEGFIVELDGRRLKTVASRPLVLPTEALAWLIADEWNAQKDCIDFETMPATRLARATLNAPPAIRADLASRVGDYAGDDLLCYFAETPPELARRQQLVWEPILIWAEAELRQPIRRSVGVVHKDQSPTMLAAVEMRALALSDLELAALASAAQLFGSTFLAFALQAGRLSGTEACATSRIDETFQAETWGLDPEAAGRAGAIEVDAQMLDQWFAALA